MKKYLGLLIVGVFVVAGVQSIVFAQGRPDISQKREQAQATAAEARERAQPPKPDVEERKAQIQQEVAQRRATIQQEVCERRQQNLVRVMPRLATGATSVKTSIDTVYERVQGFYESNQLTVDNYETHLLNIESAKANAEASLQVVSEYTFELDCENQNVGDQLAGYREAIADARESLRAYRTELVALISDLRAEAVQEQEANSEESEDEVEVENDEE
ncbi:MAG: hypothetical protein U5K77_00350 [Candidatus Saccharibacteria bacterium]|nr:hypothetical protein [Candidatus Saccharibacteria bacterium]